MSQQRSSKTNLAIGSSGWLHQQWEENYYPDDIPDEWRLNFYSHHFQCVLMRPDEWLTATSEKLAQWCEDIDESFAFFVSVTDQLDDVAITHLQQLKAQLGNQLKGLIFQSKAVTLNRSYLNDLSAILTLYADSDELIESETTIQVCWRAQREIKQASVGFIDKATSENIREVRAHLEIFLEQSTDSDLYLFFEGDPPDSSRMQETKVIHQLLS